MIATIAAALGLREGTARLLAVLLGAGALLALYGALWARGEHFRAEAVQARADAERQVATYRETYDRTFREHFAAKLAAEARGRGIKEEADADYFDATLAARDRAAVYAAGNQCVREPARADSGAAGSAGVPAAAGSSALDQRPVVDGNPELGIWISRADFDACTSAAVRLGNAHSWGENYSSLRGTAEPPGR